MVTKAFFSTSGVLLAALFFGAQAQAACSRSDIDYYLDKGFTREQVTRFAATRSSRRGEGRYEVEEVLAGGG